MRRYTTPTETFTINSIDLSEADVRVTFKQGTSRLTKLVDDLIVTYDEDEDVTTIGLTLTQEETATFNTDKECTVMVNWIFSDGTRDATDEATIEIKENLLAEVIEYGE